VIDLAWLWDSLGVLWLAALTLYALLMLALRWRHRTPHPAPLRPMPLLERLQTLVSRSVETNTPLHVSLGSRSVSAAAPEIAQAAALAASVAHTAGTAAHPLIVTSGAPTLFVATAAAGRSEPVTAEARQGSGRRAGRLRHGLVGVEPLSYAVGAWEVAATTRLAGQVCFGPFGPEGLLLQEGAHDGAAQGRGLERLSGSVELDAAALLMLGSTASAVGEDVYAASAYLRRPEHSAGLALQDAVRVCLLAGILIGLGLRLAGVWGG
jgi:hypothetical protein